MNTFMDFVGEHRIAIHNEISDFLHYIQKKHHRIWKSASIYIDRLDTYICAGKGSRGALLVLGYHIFKQNNNVALSSKSIYQLAACLELLQSFLLIHDDIIDKSAKRRGLDTMHCQLAHNKEDRKGIDRALCVGDITAMIAFELLSRISLPDNLLRSILQELSSFIAQVGIGEILDINLVGDFSVTIGTVFQAYVIKTANYSIYLPLLLGSLCAQNTRNNDILRTFSEKTGILFQIRDDELDLFSAKTGKTNACDLKNKNPSIPLLLFRDKYGLKCLEEEVLSCDINMALQALKKIQNDLYNLKQNLKAEALEALNRFKNISSDSYNKLYKLLQFAADRTQ